MAKKKSKHSKKPTAAAVSAIAATTASSDDILVKDPTQDPSDPTATATISYKVDSPPSDQVRVDDNTQAVDHTTHNNDSAWNSFTPKDHESHTDHTQEAWSSSLPEGNGKTPDHNDSSTTKDDLHYHEDQQLPIERAAPRQYEDDGDYEDGHSRNDNEHSPLIRANSHDSSGYGSGEDSRERREVETRNDNEPTTWIEWSLKQGLHPRTWNRQTYIKFGLLVTLVTLVVLSLTVFRIQDHIKEILQYIDGHKRVGAVLFILTYNVACMLFLPGSLFTVGAGFLFKPYPLALLIVLLGDATAAILAFIFGRYVFYDWVKGMMSKHPKFNALDQVIKDDGWKIVVMLRLTPIPFNLITYFFSITSIELFTVVWATCVGVLPGSCIGIWIGSLLKGLSGIDHPQLERKNLVILSMNIVLIVCAILSLSLFGKRSLRKAMKRLDQHQALTNLQEVEVVIEGAAAVIRELEDNASVPPSLRSTMIEQLAAEENDPDFYFARNGMKAAAQQRGIHDPSFSNARYSPDLEAGNSDERAESSTTSNLLGNQQQRKATHQVTAQSSGFTRGEKIMFSVIAAIAFLNVCICLPLYYHFANIDDDV